MTVLFGSKLACGRAIFGVIYVDGNVVLKVEVDY